MGGGIARPGQRFSDARPLTLLAALSTRSHVAPVRMRLKTTPLHTYTLPTSSFYSCVFHRKPLSTRRYPIPKWIRPKSVAGAPLCSWPWGGQDIIERSGPVTLYTRLAPLGRQLVQMTFVLLCCSFTKTRPRILVPSNAQDNFANEDALTA
jgi:hypothetical protein